MFNKIILNHLILTGILSLGFLSLSIGQDNNFSKDLKALGSTRAEKKKNSYLINLLKLQKTYNVHLDTNCRDRAALYRNIGMHYYNNRQKETALKFIQDTALIIAKECNLIDDKLNTQIYLNILTSKLVLGQQDQVQPLIDKLIYFLDNDRAGPIVHQAKIQSQVARYFSELGEHDQSVLWIKNSIANHNRLPLSELKLRAYLEWAYILYAMSDFKEAIAVFDSTRNLAMHMDLLHISKYNEGIVYNMAVCYEELKLYDRALHYIEKYALMTDPNNINVQSQIANLKAHIDFGHDRFKNALRNIENSIQLSYKSKDAFQILRIEEDYLFASYINLHMKQYPEAAQSAMEAMKYTLAMPESSDRLQTQFSSLFIKNQNGFNKAALSLFQAMIHFESEENIIQFADQLDQSFFSLLTDFSGDISKSEVTKRHHEFCDILLGYIFEHDLESKFPNLTSYYIATSKSLSLFELLSVKDGMPNDLRAEFDTLNHRQQSIYSALEIQEALGNSKKIDSLAQANFELGLERDKFDKELIALDLLPDFRSLRDDYVSAVQSKLTTDELLVDFFYGDNQIYSYSIDVNGVKFVADNIPLQLKEDFINTYSSTSSSNLIALDKTTKTLSNYFQPFFNDLTNETNHLIIIPDGRLLYFPFESLVISDNTLLEQSSIRYLFSYSVGEVQQAQHDKHHLPYAGFAMYYDDKILNELRHSKEASKIFRDSFTLSKLPYAIEEINTVQQRFSGKSFLNEACTRNTFFEVAEQCRILHVANHALLNENNAKLSSLVFAKDDKIDLINVIDIKKLNLNADLTILSACNSGRGELVAGNGLRSLGLSFAEAGCPAILVNLWEASDKSSKIIIDSFAKFLEEGLSKSSALQKAKLAYIKQVPRELQHPKYWANMVLIGDDSPIQINSGFDSSLKIILGVLAFFLLVGGILYLKKATK